MEKGKQSIPLSKLARYFKPGIYQHFKGGMYRAFFVARHSEVRNEEFVVYLSLEKGYVWARPLKMFLEKVTVGNKKMPRFKYISV